MTDKAYIVANREQELDVLKKLEKNGFKWAGTGTLPTKFRFSEAILFVDFPYTIKVREGIESIGWSYYSDDYKGNIVYDGRKEEKMYKVTQEFMKELIKWRDYMSLDAKAELIDTFVDGQDIQEMPGLVDAWWTDSYDSIENNNRLIAIIQWLNGEDVFEVEKPHKFMVRSERADGDGNYKYVKIFNHVALASYFDYATKFDTREEAQEWANSHQVVVEIDADGNEVE